MTWSFIPPEQAKLFGGGAAELTLSNPISTELAQMRPVAAAGPDHRRAAEPRPRLCRRRAVRAWPGLSRRRCPEDQFVAAAGVRFGHSALTGSGRHWSGEAPPLTCLPPRPMRWRRSPRSASTQASLTVTREAPAWFHPGRSGALKLGPKTLLGIFGEFHPDRAGEARRRCADRRLRALSRRDPAREAQRRRPSRARGLRPASRAARLCLRARRRRGGGRRAARRAQAPTAR